MWNEELRRAEPPRVCPLDVALETVAGHNYATVFASHNHCANWSGGIEQILFWIVSHDHFYRDGCRQRRLNPKRRAFFIIFDDAISPDGSACLNSGCKLRSAAAAANVIALANELHFSRYSPLILISYCAARSDLYMEWLSRIRRQSNNCLINNEWGDGEIETKWTNVENQINRLRLARTAERSAFAWWKLQRTRFVNASFTFGCEQMQSDVNKLSANECSRACKKAQDECAYRSRSLC